MMPEEINPAAQLAELHYRIVTSLLQEGACPGNTELARRLGVPEGRLEELMHGLADIHGLVLHPHICEPWVVHPFSLTPTANWVEGRERGWWSPCIWCALGVASLAGGKIAIHTRWGGESEPLTIPVEAGSPSAGREIWVHFAIPPARAWDNVHQHCALVLPFRSRQDVAAWCERHRVAQGEAVPLEQVAELARIWYGRHTDRDWRKWTAGEAQEIFRRVGLNSPFWDLSSKRGRF